MIILRNGRDVEYRAFNLFAVFMVPRVCRCATFFGMNDIIAVDEIGVITILQLSRTAKNSPGSGIGDIAPFDLDLLPLAG